MKNKIEQDKQNLEEFTKELSELSKKYGVVIYTKKIKMGNVVDVNYLGDFENCTINNTAPTWKFPKIDWNNLIEEESKNKDGGFYNNAQDYLEINENEIDYYWTMALTAIVTITGVDKKVARRFLDSYCGLKLAYWMAKSKLDFEESIKDCYHKYIRPSIMLEEYRLPDKKFYKTYCN